MSWSLILNRPFLLNENEKEEARDWRIIKCGSPRFEDLFDEFKTNEKDMITINELMKEEDKIPTGYVKVGDEVIMKEENKSWGSRNETKVGLEFEGKVKEDLLNKGFIVDKIKNNTDFPDITCFDKNNNKFYVECKYFGNDIYYKKRINGLKNIEKRKIVERDLTTKPILIAYNNKNEIIYDILSGYNKIKELNLINQLNKNRTALYNDS